MGLKRRRLRQRNLRIGLPTPERYSLLRKMTDVLVEHERIETTWSKAKALRSWAEPLVSWSKRIKFNLTSYRGIETLNYKMRQRCEKEETVSKMFDVMADRYRWRRGGYTRIMLTRRRYRDDAQMAFIEFIDREGELRPTQPVFRFKAWNEMKNPKQSEKKIETKEDSKILIEEIVDSDDSYDSLDLEIAGKQQEVDDEIFVDKKFIESEDPEDLHKLQ